VSGPLFVHFTAGFFADLDRQLPASRRSRVPSRADFLDQELSGIREWFSTRFEDLPPAVPGRTDYRQLITSGRVVAAMAVVGRLMPNGGLYTELLPDMVEVLGPRHPDTLGTRAQIASWTGRTGDGGTALGLYTELLPEQQAMLGAEHPATRRTADLIRGFTEGSPDRARSSAADPATDGETGGGRGGDG
jgi:hypothetical protein